jgi:hypothetical protein
MNITCDSKAFNEGMERARKQMADFTKRAYASGGKYLRAIAERDRIREEARKAPMIGEGI